MPSKNNRTKMTGDTHFPDTESEFSVEERREESAQADAGRKDTGVQEQKPQDKQDRERRQR